jgi:hypothetical protein
MGANENVNLSTVPGVDTVVPAPPTHSLTGTITVPCADTTVPTSPIPNTTGHVDIVLPTPPPILSATAPADPTIHTGDVGLSNLCGSVDDGKDSVGNENSNIIGSGTHAVVPTSNPEPDDNVVLDGVAGLVEVNDAEASDKLTASPSSPSDDELTTLSGWLKTSVKYFRSILLQKSWHSLISKWLMFEQHCQHEGVSP